jgi:hypothetical protein
MLKKYRNIRKFLVLLVAILFVTVITSQAATVQAAIGQFDPNDDLFIDLTSVTLDLQDYSKLTSEEQTYYNDYISGQNTLVLGTKTSYKGATLDLTDSAFLGQGEGQFWNDSIQYESCDADANWDTEGTDPIVTFYNNVPAIVVAPDATDDASDTDADILFSSVFDSDGDVSVNDRDQTDIPVSDNTYIYILAMVDYEEVPDAEGDGVVYVYFVGKDSSGNEIKMGLEWEDSTGTDETFVAGSGISTFCTFRDDATWLGMMLDVKTWGAKATGSPDIVSIEGFEIALDELDLTNDIDTANDLFTIYVRQAAVFEGKPELWDKDDTFDDLNGTSITISDSYNIEDGTMFNVPFNYLELASNAGRLHPKQISTSPAVGSKGAGTAYTYTFDNSIDVAGDDKESDITYTVVGYNFSHIDPDKLGEGLDSFSQGNNPIDDSDVNGGDAKFDELDEDLQILPDDTIPSADEVNLRFSYYGNVGGAATGVLGQIQNLARTGYAQVVIIVTAVLGFGVAVVKKVRK